MECIGETRRAARNKLDRRLVFIGNERPCH
jgi:hypothetical protein